jgi:hypothetical protein
MTEIDPAVAEADPIRQRPAAWGDDLGGDAACWAHLFEDDDESADTTAATIVEDAETNHEDPA